MAKQSDSTRGRGRPTFRPTDLDRGKVQALSGAGFSEEYIAEYLDIAPKTLRKYFRRELDYAVGELLAKAVSNLASALKKEEAWATCFVLKTRGKRLHNGDGWSERQEITGPRGSAIPVLTLRADRLKGMSDDELSALERAVGKLQRGIGGDQGGEAVSADEEAYTRALHGDEGELAS